MNPMQIDISMAIMGHFLKQSSCHLPDLHPDVIQKNLPVSGLLFLRNKIKGLENVNLPYLVEI
jgi:hypothetical protein